jgi:hypothetical protein
VLVRAAGRRRRPPGAHSGKRGGAVSCCQTLGCGAFLYVAVIFGGWLAGGPKVVIVFAGPAVLLAAAAVWKWRRERRRPVERTVWEQAVSPAEEAFLDGRAPMPTERRGRP